MKILQLTKKIPFPLKDGESIAIYNMAVGLVSQGAEVHLLTMNTSKHFYAGSLGVEGLSHYASVDSVFVDNRIKWGEALFNLAKGGSYHVSRFISRDFKHKLQELLQANSYDIVQMETLYLAPYLTVIQDFSKAKIVMRAHNVEFEIWERIYRNSGGWKRWYLYLQLKRLRKYELSLYASFDMWLCISDRDLDKMKALGLKVMAQTIQVPVTAPLTSASREWIPKDLVLGFIGSLDWMPNKEGLEWFLKEVWPSIPHHKIHCKLKIAGRNTPQAFFKMREKNVEVLGEVESSQSFFDSIDVLVVPLFSGSGIRIKIIEAMASGLLVLTTPVGVEGIPAKHQQTILLANTAEEFVQNLQWIQEHPQRVVEMGSKAKALVHEHFDAGHISKKLISHYRQLLGI
jgi:polysaccharide biosynthesis protein PslH